MTQNKKEKIGIYMNPNLIKRVDAEYSLYGFASRSDFICKAAEFYLGFLHSQEDTEYISKTTFAFLEDQVTKLDAKICRQLFRLCVELSMVEHVTASQIQDVDDDTLKRLRTKCIKDVKNTIGNIRYDKIYAYQHPLIEESEVYADEN